MPGLSAQQSPGLSGVCADEKRRRSRLLDCPAVAFPGTEQTGRSSFVARQRTSA